MVMRKRTESRFITSATGAAHRSLLHGWPELWYVYRKNIPVLAESFDTIVSDLRGFGDSAISWY